MIKTMNGQEYDLTNSQQRVEYWNEHAKNLLVGKTIVAAEYVTDENWGIALRIKLDDETLFWVSGDDAGNHPGALFFENDILPRMH